MFERSLIFVAVCFVIALSLCIALYPGVMTWDSASVLTYLLKAEFKKAHAPGLQYIWYILLPFSKSQSLLFILNNLFYWTAVALFSVVLSRVRFWLGWLPIITALLPYTLHMSHVVIFDVASDVFLLLFFALCLSMKLRQGSPTLFVLTLLCLTAFLMSRYNAITSLLPMALFFSYIYQKDSSFKRMIKRAIMIILISASVNQFFISALVGEKPDYIARFTAKWDLLAMSVEQGHQGISRDFPEQLKKRVDDIYDKHGWFLFLYDDDHGFQTYPAVSKKFHQTATKELWIKEILNSPLTYLKVRYKTASRMFTKQTLEYQQSPLFVWGTFENRKAVPILDPYFKDNRLNPDRMLRPDTELNPVAVFYGKALHVFMYFFPGTWAIPLIGGLLLLFCLGLVWKGFRNDSLVAVIFMNVTAVAWYFPLLILVQVPMARYVFPSDSLILFSFPVFILACLELNKNCSLFRLFKKTT